MAKVGHLGEIGFLQCALVRCLTCHMGHKRAWRILAICIVAIGCRGSQSVEEVDDDLGARLDGGAKDVADIDAPFVMVDAVDTADTGYDAAVVDALTPVSLLGDAGPSCRLSGPHEGKFVAVDPIRMLDLLFVIDNSGSMQQEQENLRKNFPAMIESLRRLPGGLPDLHLAVISSDGGAGGSAIPGNAACNRPGGDRGIFQTKPACGLQEGANFLKASNNGSQKNFEGSLEDVFGCMADLGTQGCGFEHQLQSLRVALSPKVQPLNSGFLRPGAHLAVVLITDEDDCSANPDSDLFVDPSFAGQHGSFRCNVEGHLCNGTPVVGTISSTPLQNCSVREDGRLISVGTFSRFLKELQGPASVTVSVVAGLPDNPQNASYDVVKHELYAGQAMIDVGPVCSNTTVGSAAPALRLQSFVEAFGDNGSFDSLCSNDLTPALSRIGGFVASRLSPGCVAGKLADNDVTSPGLQARCLVREQIPNSTTGTYDERVVPACAPGLPKPCWRVLEPSAAANVCGASQSQVVIDDDAQTRPRGTRRSIQCLSCDE